MLYSEVGLGDLVAVYLDHDRRFSSKPTDHTISGTIIGRMNPRHSGWDDEDPIVVIGWMPGVIKPSSYDVRDEDHGAEHNGYDWIRNSTKYVYRRRTEVSAHCGGILMRGAAQQSAPDPAQDWRNWVRKIPGECPCGSSLIGPHSRRYACGYHSA